MTILSSLDLEYYMVKQKHDNEMHGYTCAVKRGNEQMCSAGISGNTYNI